MELELGGAEDTKSNDKAVEGGELCEVATIVGLITVTATPHVNKSVKAGSAKWLQVMCQG